MRWWVLVRVLVDMWICVIPEVQGVWAALPGDGEVHTRDAGVAAGLEVFHSFVLHLSEG